MTDDFPFRGSIYDRIAWYERNDPSSSELIRLRSTVEYARAYPQWMDDRDSRETRKYLEAVGLR